MLFSGKTFPELNRQRFSSQIESYEERRGVPPSDGTCTARPIDLLRDMPQFVIIEPKHSAKQNYVPVSNLR